MTDQQQPIQQQAEKHMAALEGWLAPFFAKAPHIPENGRRTIVDIAPWLALIFGVLGLVSVLGAGAIASVFTLAFLGGLYDFAMFVTLAAGLCASALELLAYRPLAKREKKGWNYLFYGTVLTAAAAVVNLVVGYDSGLTGQVLGALIGLWILFEIRGQYH